MPDELAVLRASAHRLAPYGVRGPSLGGWTAVAAESVAPLALAVRTPGCVLRWPPEPGMTALDLTVYGAGGEVVHLDRDASAERAERAAALLGEAEAGPLLHRALTVESPFYEAADRVADVCRALGVPLDLLAPDSTVEDAPAEPATPDVGFVLMRVDVAAGVAWSPLTQQSAWIVPMGRGWCLQVWDGDPPRQPLPVVAIGLSEGHRDGFALAVWWSGTRRAGLLLSRSGRAVAAHEWSRVDLGLDHTAAAGRVLAATFHVPERALDVTSVLRRDATDPAGALVDLLTLLRVPTPLVGLEQDRLVDAARSVPGAVHAPRLSTLRAIVHAVQQTPATNVVDRAARERPRWYRVVNGLVAVVMGLATFVLYLNWRWDVLSGWWVVLGAVTTLVYAVGTRPPRRRRF